MALAAIPASSILARRVGAVGVPRADRWNRKSVPTLGGLGIALGMVCGLLVAPLDPVDRLAIVGGIAAFVALGLIDDLRGLPPSSRVAVEVLVAALFAIAVTADLPAPLRIAGIVVAMAIVPLAVNATNLVDNADGLASILSVVTAVTLAGIVFVAPVDSLAAGAALVVATSCAAFLVFNRPPARVFMGDSGSLSVGFALAATAFLIVRDSIAEPAPIRLAVSLALPLAFALQVGDLAMVFITRLRRGASPFQGGIDHTSHRLLAAGLGPVRMIVGLGLLAALVGAAAIGLTIVVGDFRLVALLAVAVGVLVGAFEAVVAWRLPHDAPRVRGSAADGGASLPSDDRPAHVGTPVRVRRG